MSEMADIKVRMSKESKPTKEEKLGFPDEDSIVVLWGELRAEVRKRYQLEEELYRTRARENDLNTEIERLMDLVLREKKLDGHDEQE